MRGASRAAPSVPVILITDERAVLVARLDDKHTVGTHDDQWHDIRAVVAWRIARPRRRSRRAAAGPAVRRLAPRAVRVDRERRAPRTPCGVPPFRPFRPSAPDAGWPASIATSSPLVLPLWRLTCD